MPTADFSITPGQSLAPAVPKRPLDGSKDKCWNSISSVEDAILELAYLAAKYKAVKTTVMGRNELLKTHLNFAFNEAYWDKECEWLETVHRRERAAYNHLPIAPDGMSLLNVSEVKDGVCVFTFKT